MTAATATIACTAVTPAAAPGGQTLTEFEYAQVEMGVSFRVLLYALDRQTANDAAQAVFARIAELNRIMSDYDPDSELSRLSKAAPTEQGVAVSDDLWRVLSRSQELANQSAGAFDITVGPYVRLWRRARREKELPSPERLAEARPSVGYQHLKLNADDRTASLLRPNMRLDLGGIAIGFAVDEGLAILRKRGIRSALIDASGDIGLGDPPPGKDGWRIGIAPLEAEAPPSRFLLLANCAITTSGDAFQFVEIGGKRYSHIVDPRTGLGLTTRSSVTVVADDCMSADSLTKPVCVLGPQEGLEFIERATRAAALVVQSPDSDADRPQVFESERFKKLRVVEPGRAQ